MLERQVRRYVAQPGLPHDQQLLVGVGGVAADRPQVALLVAGGAPGPGRRRLAGEGTLGGAAGALPVAHREVRGVVYEKHGSTEPESTRAGGGTECGTPRILIWVLPSAEMARDPAMGAGSGGGWSPGGGRERRKSCEVVPTGCDRVRWRI